MQDWYHETYDDAPTTGHPAWETPAGTYRLLRGGAFLTPPDAVRASNRYAGSPVQAGADLGIRCCRSAL